MFRVIAFLILLLPLTPSPRPAGPSWFTAADAAVLHRAAHLMVHRAPATVAKRLLRAHAASSAVVGRDGRTLNLVLPDGTRAAILPRSPHPAALLPSFRPLIRTRAGSGQRAIVLEPFHEELALPGSEGPDEASALRAAGFNVDVFTDQQVTVQTMLSLTNYNLVYMLVHSGINQYGEGVIATGQIATPDPAVKPYYQDHSVIVTGVAGTSTNYFGVVSEFFAWHAGQFPPDSIVIADGCSLLQAPLLWKAFQSHGVSTMVGWDAEAMSPDEVAAGQQFTAAFAGGASVADAIASVSAKGYGQSDVLGVIGHFGYLGDGSLTVNDVLSPHPTPTALPTSLPIPTATPVPPTSTPRPTATPTATSAPSAPHGLRAWPHIPPLSGVHVQRP